MKTLAMYLTDVLGPRANISQRTWEPLKQSCGFIRAHTRVTQTWCGVHAVLLRSLSGAGGAGPQSFSVSIAAAPVWLQDLGPPYPSCGSSSLPIKGIADKTQFIGLWTLEMTQRKHLE